MILIIGYGNVMRSDDGVGVYIAKSLLKEGLDGATMIMTQQLHVELLEDAITAEKVVLIDACQNADGDVALRPVRSQSEQMVSSHHLTPELFLELAKKVYKKDLSLFVCSVKGEDFSIGNTISKETRQRAEKAISKIKEFVKEHATIKTEKETDKTYA